MVAGRGRSGPGVKSTHGDDDRLDIFSELFCGMARAPEPRGLETVFVNHRPMHNSFVQLGTDPSSHWPDGTVAGAVSRRRWDPTLTNPS